MFRKCENDQYQQSYPAACPRACNVHKIRAVIKETTPVRPLAYCTWCHRTDYRLLFHISTFQAFEQ
eukprot:6782902-Lingulodinium_polyedra.AAC.1